MFQISTNKDINVKVKKRVIYIAFELKDILDLLNLMSLYLSNCPNTYMQVSQFTINNQIGLTRVQTKHFSLSFFLPSSFFTPYE